MFADILETDAGGPLLANSERQLQLVPPTSDGADVVEILRLDAGVGPCVDCFTTGTPVAVGDIAGSGVSELNAADLPVAQALADVATIGIVQERIVRDSGIVAEQLQRALHHLTRSEVCEGVMDRTLEITNISAATTAKLARKWVSHSDVMTKAPR